MKIVAETQALRRAVSSLAQLLPRKSDIPILATICVTASGNAATLHATDTDTTIEFTIAAQVDEEGAAAIPGSAFAAFLDGLPEGSETSLEAAQTVTLKSGRRQATLGALLADDMPPFFADVDGGVAGEMPLADLEKMARAATLCLPTSTGRIYFSGVHLRNGGERLILEAADGIGLLVYPLEARMALRKEWSIIVPASTAKLLPRIFPAGATFTFNDRKMLVEANGVRLTSKLVDGIFPDLSVAIPPAEGLSIEVEAAEFVRAVKATTKIAADLQDWDIKWVKIEPTAEGELRISLPTRHIASAAEETIAATSEGADGRSFAIAIKMVMEVIDGLGAETLRITQTETGRNVRIDPIGGDGRFGCLAPVRA